MLTAAAGRCAPPWGHANSSAETLCCSLPPQAGTTLFACAVLLRWKDASVTWFVKQHVETLDQGQELITGFLNPASKWVGQASGARWKEWSFWSCGSV